MLFYQNSNIKGFDLEDGVLTAQDYLDMFTPQFYQGKQNTIGVCFNIGF
jgi:hypothetical protein